MKSKKRIILVSGAAKLLLIVYVFAVQPSCRKYEEGPYLILTSKCKRIVGIWELEYLYINENDSTYAVKSQSCYSPLNFVLESETNKAGKWISYASPNKCYDDGGWYFDDHKEYHNVRRYYLGDSIGIRSVEPYLAKGNVEWRITRLTESELWLKVDYQGTHSWVHYKKK